MFRNKPVSFPSPLKACGDKLRRESILQLAIRVAKGKWIPACAGMTVLTLSPLLSLANPNNALLHITSDTSQYNYKIGDTWFEGHVVADQGTTHLTADRLITTKNAQNQIQQATAFGTRQLAHYWTQPKKGEKILNAYAKVMKLYPAESRIILEGNVLVTQGENRFQGQIIVYNIKQQTITVPPTKNSRSTFVIEVDQIKNI